MSEFSDPMERGEMEAARELEYRLRVARERAQAQASAPLPTHCANDCGELCRERSAYCSTDCRDDALARLKSKQIAGKR